MKKAIVFCLVGLLVVSACLSFVFAIDTKDETTKDILPGELKPERGIVEWSNPRYENGSAIDWESKREYKTLINDN